MPLQCQDDIYAVSTTENRAVDVDILSLVKDSEGDIDLASLTLVNGPLFGSASVNNGGTITYIPPLGFTGTDLFVYSICDLGMPSFCCTDPHATVVVYVHSSSQYTGGKPLKDHLFVLKANRIKQKVLQV